MSDDDTPPEALFFTKRAAFVPKVSAEQFEAVSKMLHESTENIIMFPEKDKVLPTIKRTKPRNALRKLLSEPEEIIVDDFREFRPPSPLPELSTATKRRLKKHQAERASEIKLIEAANRQVMKEASKSSACNEVEEVFDSTFENNINVILTLSYMSEISRFRCYEHEKFSTIFPKVADLFNLKASELLLCLRDTNIKVEDTPKSLNITLNDIIECIPYKSNEHAKDEDVDKIRVIFQSNDSNEKIDLYVHKLEKMQEVMQRYSEKRAIPLDKLSFEFDGEKIEGTETPDDLDMESGNCIDVQVVAKSPVKVARGQRGSRSPRAGRGTRSPRAGRGTRSPRAGRGIRSPRAGRGTRSFRTGRGARSYRRGRGRSISITDPMTVDVDSDAVSVDSDSVDERGTRSPRTGRGTRRGRGRSSTSITAPMTVDTDSDVVTVDSDSNSITVDVDSDSVTEDSDNSDDIMWD